MSDPYADGWPDAEKNSIGCWEQAVAALRERKVAAWPEGKYGAILADPPWRFQVWSGQDKRVASRGSVTPYNTMTMEEISALPVASLAAENCCLFMWVVWPTLPEAIDVIKAWGFKYKTCGFAWVKADVSTVNLFDDPVDAYMGLGYWTRANSEVCLLATKGKPKRLNADVRQGIIAPRREHSRKPDGIHERQVTFACVVNGMTVCKYIADFTYERGNDLIAEDTKGFQTQTFKLKAKLVKACHGFDIQIHKVRR